MNPIARSFVFGIALSGSALAWGQSSSEVGEVVFAPAPASVPARGVAPSLSAVTWDDTSMHLLDNGLNPVGNFPVGASNPNGAAVGNGLFFAGFFTTQEVIAYDGSGVEQFRWTGTFPNLQGMAFVNGEIAIASGADITFHDASTGAVSGSIPNLPSVEGLAYDGSLLWLLDADLVGVDPADGSPVQTWTNPASGCSFGGSGLAFDGTYLLVGCSNGDWFRVDPADGSVFESGNNGLNIFGLGGGATALPEARAVPALGTWGLVLMGLVLAGMAGVFGFKRVKA